MEEIAEYLAKSDESEFVYLVTKGQHHVGIRAHWGYTIAGVSADTFEAGVAGLVGKIQEGRL